ncbi:hypothetical protein [Streptomyces sp. NPDC093589]|uniref:hypothetical protein n=1 Tax=Streptomyces sp. NPDC093589 TaxID=3366043 RepID=UPI0037FC18E0
MSLDVTATTYLQVEHTELERFIAERLGRSYDIVDALDVDRGAYHQLTVTADGDDGDLGAQLVGEWLDGDGEQPDLDFLLDHLARSAAIPAGDYLIRTSG